MNDESFIVRLRLSAIIDQSLRSSAIIYQSLFHISHLFRICSSTIIIDYDFALQSFMIFNHFQVKHLIGCHHTLYTVHDISCHQKQSTL
jgi:hypothetical protein